MVELHDEDICRVKADIERQKKMCAELERACKNMVSELCRCVWRGGAPWKLGWSMWMARGFPISC